MRDGCGIAKGRRYPRSATAAYEMAGRMGNWATDGSKWQECRMKAVELSMGRGNGNGWIAGGKL